MALLRRSPNAVPTALSGSSLFRWAGTYQAVFASLFFGGQIATLSGTATGLAYCAGALHESFWAQAQSGWTLNSATRSVVVMHNPPDDGSGIAGKLVLEDSADGVGIMVPVSQDGRSGFLARVLETGGTRRLRLTRVVEAQLIDDSAMGAGNEYITTGVGDTPSSAAADIDVSARLATATRYSLIVKKVAGLIQVSINDDPPDISHQTVGAVYGGVDSPTLRPSAYTWFPTMGALAFVSDTNGARVISADAFPLKGKETGRAEVLVAVCGGNLYAGDTDAGPRQVAAGVFPVDVPCDGTEYNGLMLMVGGGKARQYAPTSNLAGPYTPTDGTLPGQTEPGTTTGHIIERIGTRVEIADVTGNEQNVLLSAVGNQLDWNTGKDLPGVAYAFSGYKALKLGKPVKAVAEMSNGSNFIGCTSSIYVVLGDPIRGYTEAQEKAKDVGVTGKDAVWVEKSGKVIAHSSQGLLTVSLSGTVKNISARVLSNGIQFKDLPADLVPIVIRDAARHGTHVFLTRLGGGSLHFWYDEQQGEWGENNGGFHPETWPADFDPVCATVWGGQVLLGCRDGYIRYFVDDADNDDGTPIDSFTTLTQLATGSEQQEVIVTRTEMVLGSTSGPVHVQFIKGRTSEKAFKSGKVVIDKTVSPTRPTPIIQGARGPALLVRLSGSKVRFERLDVLATIGNNKSMG